MEKTANPQDPENPVMQEATNLPGKPEDSEKPEKPEKPEKLEKPENHEKPGDPEGPDQETLIAEAELRGYLRGRNEAIERLMREPSTLERPTDPAPGVPSDPDSSPMILSNPRVSIWDR